MFTSRSNCSFQILHDTIVSKKWQIITKFLVNVKKDTFFVIVSYIRIIDSNEFDFFRFLSYLLIIITHFSVNRVSLMKEKCTCNASWHIRSPRASPTSRIPINFALKMTPSPKKRPGSFRSVMNKSISVD